MTNILLTLHWRSMEYALMFHKLLFLCHFTHTILIHIKGHSSIKKSQIKDDDVGEDCGNNTDAQK